VRIAERAGTPAQPTALALVAKYLDADRTTRIAGRNVDRLTNATRRGVVARFATASRTKVKGRTVTLSVFDC
jgi:hypothetical protein